MWYVLVKEKKAGIAWTFVELLEAVIQWCSVKKGAHRNFIKFYNFIKKETLAQVFPSEICEISKNTFFHRTLWWLLLNHIKIHSLEMINIQ